MTASFLRNLEHGKWQVLHSDTDLVGGSGLFFRKDISGIRLGVLSLSPYSREDTLERTRSMYGAYQRARLNSDILVLLDQKNVVDAQWIERVAGRFGFPDVVIGGPNRLPKEESEMVGQTMDRADVLHGCVCWMHRYCHL